VWYTFVSVWWRKARCASQWGHCAGKQSSRYLNPSIGDSPVDETRPSSGRSSHLLYATATVEYVSYRRARAGGPVINKAIYWLTKRESFSEILQFLSSSLKQKQRNSVAFSPQAKYTDSAIATCWQNLIPTFADRGVSRGQRGGSPTAVNHNFSRPEPLLFIQVAPHLSSQELSGPRSIPTPTQKIW
jgi:hypothetical protein